VPEKRFYPSPYLASPINYPAASGRGIKRETIGNFHAVYDIPFPGF
jgi:hypothetical protein